MEENSPGSRRSPESDVPSGYSISNTAPAVRLDTRESTTAMTCPISSSLEADRETIVSPTPRSVLLLLLAARSKPE